ncbi:unnamed protein product [Chrysoparadoxa australica]
MSQVSEGDTVTVLGGTGGLGRYVVKNITSANKFKVRCIVRSVEKAEELFKELGIEGVDLVQGDLLQTESLKGSVSESNALVFCTGTTAFPTGKWRGGNIPVEVDYNAIERVLEILSDGSTPLKRLLYLSSVGVERKDKPPFSILNTFGVLDAKIAAEDAIMRTAEEAGFDAVILRPGRLIGEPWTTPDVATLLKLEAPTRLKVEMQQGDEQEGDVSRGSAAEVFAQALTQPAAAGKRFTIVNKTGEKPSQEQWDELFDSL